MIDFTLPHLNRFIVGSKVRLVLSDDKKLSKFNKPNRELCGYVGAFTSFRKNELIGRVPIYLYDPENLGTIMYSYTHVPLFILDTTTIEESNFRRYFGAEVYPYFTEPECKNVYEMSDARFLAWTAAHFSFFMSKDGMYKIVSKYYNDVLRWYYNMDSIQPVSLKLANNRTRVMGVLLELQMMGKVYYKYYYDCLNDNIKNLLYNTVKSIDKKLKKTKKTDKPDPVIGILHNMLKG